MKSKLLVSIVLSMLILILQVGGGSLSDITTHAVSQQTGSFDVSDFPPVIDAVSEYTADAGDLVTINVTAYDPNGNSVTVTYGLPLNSTGQWQTAINEAGIHYANITASDGTLQTIHTVTITILGGCGDGICYSNESCTSCPTDCGSCAPSGGGGGGGGGGSVPPAQDGCVPDWQCNAWTPCTNNHQSRTCFDANTCSSVTFRPPTEQTCGGGCAERWSCTEWSTCESSALQTRTCNDLAKCGTTYIKPLTERKCTYNHPVEGKTSSAASSGSSISRDEDSQDAEDKTEGVKEGIKDLITGVATAIIPSKQKNTLHLLVLLALIIIVTIFIIAWRRRKSKKEKTVSERACNEAAVQKQKSRQPKKRKVAKKPANRSKPKTGRNKR